MTVFSSDTVLLFGSAARRDNDARSDVDILVISDVERPKALKYRKVETQFMPRTLLLDKAKHGDLFAAHLAFEAEVISDPENFFPIFRESFVRKESYSAERLEANLLAAYLSNLPEARFSKISFKRSAWCLRTVLISLIAEAGSYVFSPRGMIERYPFDFVVKLLELRRGGADVQETQNLLKSFLDWQGQGNLHELRLTQVERSIRESEFSVAKATLAKIRSDINVVRYWSEAD